MKVQINYNVPVSATVDLDAGKVEEVLWPTAIERCDGEHDVVAIGTQLPATLEQRIRAREIADSRTWPDWHVAQLARSE